MGAVIFILVLASIFMVMAIFLFLGKGSWMIAGFNTAPAEEKEKYDDKKLCKATGTVLLIVSLLLYIMAYLGYKVESEIMNENQMLPFAIIFIIVVFCAVGFDIYYTNKKCRK